MVVFALIITAFCFSLVVIPCIFAAFRFIAYKANGGKRRDFIFYCMDYLKEIF